MATNQVKQKKKNIGKDIWSFLQNLIVLFEKENVISILVNFAFWILLIVFLYMNVTFYANSSKTFSEKLAIGAIVGCLEIVATWLLFKIASIKIRKMSQNFWFWVFDILKIAGLIILYFGLSIPSISSRVAYTINAINEQSKVVYAQTSDQEQNQLKIDSIDIELSNLKDELRKGESYSTNLNEVKWYKRNLVLKINKKTDERKRYSDKKGEYSKVENSSSAEDAYTIMGKPFKIAGLTMFTILLIIRLFSLDICIILIVFLSKRKDIKKESISESINDTDEKKLADFIRKNKADLIKYVTSLMQYEDDKVRLQKDSIITQETNIPIKLCKKFRELLKTKITYGKIPVIESRRGSTSSSFFKRDVLEILENYSKLY
jgi:uncharacterized membrane protein (DUF485 family)